MSLFKNKKRSNLSKIVNLYILVLITFIASAAHAEDVVLNWVRPDDDRVAGYKIFYGPADKDFKSGPKKVINSPAQTSCDILGLENGQTYGFAAKSIDGKGNESVFSEVLYYDVPPVKEDNDSNGDSTKKSSSSGGGGGGCFIHCSGLLQPSAK